MVELPHIFLKNPSTLVGNGKNMKERDRERLHKIGVRVRKLREKRNLSQEQLAARCDVDRAKISKIENATANYTITTLIELAKGMGVQPKIFMDVDFEFDSEE